jgi:hypothetical protein
MKRDGIKEKVKVENIQGKEEAKKIKRGLYCSVKTPRRVNHY